MIVLWAFGALALGFALGRFVPEPKPAHAGCTVAIGAKQPLTARLEDVIESARARALWIEIRHQGFEVIDQYTKARPRLSVQVPDPQHVTVPSLQLSRTPSLTLPFELALALVPVFGPLTVVVDGEIYEVDGTRDQHALTNELSSRLTARARSLIPSQRR